MKTFWNTLRGLERCCMTGDKYNVASYSYVLCQRNFQNFCVKSTTVKLLNGYIIANDK